MVLLALTLVLGATPSSATAAHVQQIEKRIAKKLDGQTFHIVVHEPFIIIGDESGKTVERRARSTVTWASDALKKEYFAKDPPLMEVWLFKDKASYDKNVRTLFKDRPDTPFGYYSPQHNALIMNIATGGGTLVHEMVHPYVEANFPNAPAWFNEGLGSLYEQCGERRGRIVGFTNWRLSGLQEAIRAGELPSFKELTSTSSYAFYEKDPGTNYGQSRYLLYYLQEKGLLQRYYKELVSHQEEDPTGYATLQRVLGREDMKAFQKEWEAWVLRLEF